MGVGVRVNTVNSERAHGLSYICICIYFSYFLSNTVLTVYLICPDADNFYKIEHIFYVHHLPYLLEIM